MGQLSQGYQAHRCSFHPDRQDPYLRLGAVTIYVRDQDRSLHFYLEQLGFSLAFDTFRPSGERWLAVSPPDGTAVLTLVSPKPGSDEYRRIGRSAEVVFLTEDVVGKFQQWRDRGVRFQGEPQVHPSGAISASFEDLDGNCFTLLCVDEVTSEVEAQRKAHAARMEAQQHTARELELARQVQSRLFPQTQPMTKTLEYAGVCIQARHVGGDYYDFLDLGRDRLGLVVADVSGKGTAAALLMASLQAHLHNQGATYWSRPYVPIVLDQPARFLCSVNRLFYENSTEDAYATLFFAEYDDQLRRVRYANCGHLSGLLLRHDGRHEWLQSTSTVLGMFGDLNCSVEERSLLPGDTLALYTDGVTEAMNEAGEEFGEERLIETLRKNRELPSQALLGSLVDGVRRFGSREQRDDITLVVARCRTV
jgi:serine phosphatase RsbU (regulator of sigma subunit)/predicted enzyme related to lactoylglutathione lyase